jgi:hypothetical protein
MCQASPRDGIVHETIPGIALRANLPLDSVIRELEWLSKPDRFSRNKNFEGRRIEIIDDGIRLLNYDLYKYKDYSTPRVARYRALHSKKKSLLTVTETTDTDKKKLKEKDPEPQAIENEPWLEIARAYKSRYEFESGNAWMNHARHRSDFSAVADWLEAQSARTTQNRVGILAKTLEGFFMDEWAKSKNWPVGALAKNPGKYFNPAPSPEIVAEKIKLAKEFERRLHAKIEAAKEKGADHDKIQEIIATACKAYSEREELP